MSVPVGDDSTHLSAQANIKTIFGENVGKTGPVSPTLPSSGPADGVLVAGELAGLPNYKIESKLGEGGMGAVYRARQQTLDRTVAIKVLPLRLCNNALYVARLNREARVLAKINHPNVIGCYDLGEHNGMRYVVMEYVEGENLARLVETRKHLPQVEALHYLKQAVMGLDHAQVLGIIHRDIKPENMLLAKATRTGTTMRLPVGQTLKIADLGLATFTGEEGENTRLTAEGSTLGSPHYMSPEQAVGDSDIDFRTDIYALGITLYHMLTGKTPHTAPTVAAVLAKKLSQSIPDPRSELPELVPSLSLLIQKMTARKKEDRYLSYGELLHDIESVEKGIALTAKVLPPDRASLALLPETIANLKHSPTQADSAASERVLPRAWISSPIGIALIMGALLGIGAFVLNGLMRADKESVSVSGNKPHADEATPSKENALPLNPGQPPGNSPTTQMPSTRHFSMQSLLEKESIQNWTYRNDAKDFGFQEGALFLQNIQSWNEAERTLPGTEYALRAHMQIPMGADEFEMRLGFSDKDYIAFGIRFPMGVEKVSAYVERRNINAHEVLEKLATKDAQDPDRWQILRVNVWGGQATCFLTNELLVSAELGSGWEKSKLLRIAINKGIGRIQILEVSPPSNSK